MSNKKKKGLIIKMVNEALKKNRLVSMSCHYGMFKIHNGLSIKTHHNGNKVTVIVISNTPIIDAKTICEDINLKDLISS